MSRNAGIIVCKDVSFAHDAATPILEGANFVVRRGSKLTLMGQNGAGKSTIFSLLTGALAPDEGKISIEPRTTIATARQLVPREELDWTVRKFFQACFVETVYDIDPKIDTVLEAVGLVTPDIAEDIFKERSIASFSGGQKARLLLAQALIQRPDVLLLDEPTNNLDDVGIAHLTNFLRQYNKTVLVISHDADFLNAFTDGVLYLHAQRRQVEQYNGNYHQVVKEIAAQVEKEQRKNAQLSKSIQANKDKINYFAGKGGKMRMVAKRLRDEVEEHEDSKVAVRQEDKTIRPFTIIPRDSVPTTVVSLTSYQVIRNGAVKEVPCQLELKRGEHLQIVGPNGIGKTTLLEHLASGAAPGELVTSGVRIGYYRQDFSNLDFEKTVYETLMAAMPRKVEEDMRSIAAGFLLHGDIMKSRVGRLSEGQKGLVSLAALCMEGPGLLIMDEPTNHINFRHLPVIAEALHNYTGALILVSHVPDFVEQVRIDTLLDLGAKKKS